MIWPGKADLAHLAPIALVSSELFDIKIRSLFPLISLIIPSIPLTRQAAPLTLPSEKAKPRAVISNSCTTPRGNNSSISLCRQYRKPCRSF
jgi:hypothetical protein